MLDPFVSPHLEERLPAVGQVLARGSHGVSLAGAAPGAGHQAEKIHGLPPPPHPAPLGRTADLREPHHHADVCTEAVHHAPDPGRGQAAVCVRGQDELSPGLSDTQGQGGFLGPGPAAGFPGAQQPHRLAGRNSLMHDRSGRVGRTIVHHDDLAGFGWIGLGQQVIEGVADVGGFVPGCHHDRDQGSSPTPRTEGPGAGGEPRHQKDVDRHTHPEQNLEIRLDFLQ